MKTSQPEIIGILTPDDLDSTVVSLVEEAARLTAAGASIIEIDTLPDGPFHAEDPDDEVDVGLLVHGLTDAGYTVAVRTTSAHIAALALERGATWIADPSGATLDPEMGRVLSERGAHCMIGPWPAPGDPRRRGTEDENYAEGIVRNAARLLQAGVRGERIVVDSGVGARRDDPEPWRMLNHIDRLRRLGYPVLVDGCDRTLETLAPDGATDERLDDAAVALTLLATGARAWGIRTVRAGRVAGAIHRIFEPSTARIHQ